MIARIDIKFIFDCGNCNGRCSRVDTAEVGAPRDQGLIAHPNHMSGELIRNLRARCWTNQDVAAADIEFVRQSYRNGISSFRSRQRCVIRYYGNRWTRERVTSLRSHHRIAVYKPADDGIEPWLTLSKAARLLHVAPKTLRLAAEAGEIESIHPLPDGPWIFSRAVLSSSPARAITERARQNPKYSRDRFPISKASSLQSHRQMGVVMRGCRSADSGRSKCVHR